MKCVPILQHITRLAYICIVVTTTWTQTAAASQNRMQVVFLNPSSQQDLFWAMTTDFMQAAAADLGVNLEVVYTDRNHILTVKKGRAILQRSSPPDYLLIGNDKRSAGPIIESAEKRGVDVFLFNNGFVQPQDIKKYGTPRKPYTRWIGQYIPNNYSAGFQTGDILIREGLSRRLLDPTGRLNIVAFAGSFATHASKERTRGLEEAVAAHGETVSLLQVFPGDWSEKTAAGQSKMMFSRYANKRIGAIWGANDAMIFGVLKSAREIGIAPGRDMLFGGIGWHTDALHMVKNGELTTNVGGHYMDGAWSLIMIYDHHYGRDFFNDPVKSDFYPIDQSNVDRFLAAFEQEDWQRIDFTRFSKVLNPRCRRYDFSLEAVFQALQ